MASVIMVYSTTDGHTRKICERLRSVIERQQHEGAKPQRRGQQGRVLGGAAAQAR